MMMTFKRNLLLLLLLYTPFAGGTAPVCEPTPNSFALLPPNTEIPREAGALADTILADTDLKRVLLKARALMRQGLNAGEGYGEVWIRDLNTVIDLAVSEGQRVQVREALHTFFLFQGEDGHIIDGFIPAERAIHDYRYIETSAAPHLRGHKNTVETDQETSLVQAVYRYLNATGDSAFFDQVILGQRVRERLRRALEYPLRHRFSKQYGLIWGATTADWGDVQPEHEWGVELDRNSHRAVDVYDNAMWIIAASGYAELVGTKSAEGVRMTELAERLRANLKRHLWDRQRHKFRPHIYLDGSPFPKAFNESHIYYHGGTGTAIKAGVLSAEEIAPVYRDMLNNKALAGAASLGLTLYPAYPKGFFANAQMQPYHYQNGGDWTWFGARIVAEMARRGYAGLAYRELRPMVERVLENNGFFEWYGIDNQPHGSSSFKGSAGVLANAIGALTAWAEGVHACDGG